MSKPLMITISHSLGKDAAVTNLKSGLHDAQSKFGQFVSIQEETWIDNRLQFRVSALAQSVSGTIDVFEDHVKLEIFLPWLLSKIADAIQPLIRREATLL